MTDIDNKNALAGIPETRGTRGHVVDEAEALGCAPDHMEGLFLHDPLKVTAVDGE